MIKNTPNTELTFKQLITAIENAQLTFFLTGKSIPLFRVIFMNSKSALERLSKIHDNRKFEIYAIKCPKQSIN